MSTERGAFTLIRLDDIYGAITCRLMPAITTYLTGLADDGIVKTSLTGLRLRRLDGGPR